MLQRPATCAELATLDSMNRGCKLDDGVLSTRVNGMKSYFKLGVVFCVIALSIGASAGSITAGPSAAPNGVQGTSNYNLATGGSLSFVGNSVFGGLSGTGGQAQSSSNLLASATAGGRTVLPNQLEFGSNSPIVPITSGEWWSQHQQQVPEGGTELSYLVASGLVLFAGIFLAGKQRRRSA